MADGVGRVAAVPSPAPAHVQCKCGHVIFDGEVIRSRCVKVLEAKALCRCKRWVAVPVQPIVARTGY